MPFVDLYADVADAATADGELDVVDETCVSALQALLPPGVLWTREPDANLTLLIRALSYEYSRLKRRGRQLLEELDPRTAKEMLDDLERVYGLPSECTQPTTLAGRRAALHARMLGYSDPTQAYFEDLITRLGVTLGEIITRDRNTVLTCVEECTGELYDESWIYVWDVVTLTSALDEQVRCAINEVAPSHTLPRFLYTLNWTSRTSGVSTHLRGVHFANDLWVAVGDSDTGALPVILTSTDGTTWTSRTASTAINTHLYGVTYGAGLWVVVGSGSEVNTSPDGTTWTDRTSVAGTWRAVAYNGTDLFCAVGNSGAIQTSPDGITWTSRTSGTSEHLRSITYAESLWVAVGDSGTVLTSANGITWTARTSGVDGDLYSVRHDGSTFVAVGDARTAGADVMATLISSADAITWTIHSVGSTIQVLYAAGVNTDRPLWAIFGYNNDDSLPYSMAAYDVVSWGPMDELAGDEVPTAVAHDGESRWVRVGAGGTIYTSDN